MKPRLVSILMSVHNGEKYVRAALTSVFAQADCDFEVIFIDDASTDDTVAIVSSFSDTRLKIFALKTNIGLVDALNHAASQAQGEYLARMDADDLYQPLKLAKQLERFETEKDLVLLATGFNYIDDADRVFDTATAQSDDSILRVALLTEGNQFCHTSVMMRASAFREVGGYRKVAGRYAQDYDLWLRLMEIGSIGAISGPLVRYRVHTDMISVTKLPQQRYAAEIYRQLAIQRQGGQGEDLQAAESVLEKQRSILKMRLAGDYLRFNQIYARMGQPDVARKMLLQAIKTAPHCLAVHKELFRSIAGRLKRLFRLVVEK